MKENRAIRLIVTAALTLLVAFSCAPLWAQADEVSAEVASIKGTVTVKRAASEKSFAAFAGLKLKQGDVVTTAAGGEIVINIGEDKTVKALSDSSFKISNLTGTDAASEAGFTLIKGVVFNEVRSPQSTTEGMTVRTGNTVVGVRGTTYTISLRGRDGLTVHTLEGSVFLDTVIKRLTEEQNAALVHQQTTVDAGQGVSQGGTYELTIDVLTPTELQYIVDNPDSFAPALVAEAGETLTNLPAEVLPPAEDSTEIVYQPGETNTGTQANESGGGGGGGGATVTSVSISPATASVALGGTQQFAATVTGTGSPSQAVAWTIEGTPSSGTSISAGGLLTVGANETATTLTVRATSTVNTSKSATAVVNVGPAGPTYYVNFFVNAPNYVEYYCPVWSPVQVAAGNTLASVPAACKLGYTFDGWFDAPTGGNQYVAGQTPVTSNLTLHPQFTQNFSALGDGTSSASPFLINASNFAHFRYFVHTEFTAASVAGYSVAGLDACYELAGNITFTNFSSLGWEPIGSNLYKFSGSFDGYGNAISGFDLTTTTSAYSGFFGYIQGGTVKNLNISGTVTATYNSGQLYAGIIAGYSSGATISKCSVSGTITATSTANAVYAGGIVGLADTSAIAECSANVAMPNVSSSGGAVHAGGIVGLLDGISSSITNCEASGNIQAVTMASNTSFAGGIAGGNSTGATIEYCYFSGTVFAGSGSAAIAGGIAGSNIGSIANCVAYSGAVSGSAAGGIAAGRIWGTVAGTGSNNYSNDAFTVSGGTTAIAHDAKDGLDIPLNGLEQKNVWETTFSWDIYDSSTNLTGIWQWSGNGPPTLLNTP